jgi:hypothetical protein
VIAQALTQGELLAIWDRGEGASVTRRAMAMLAGAAPSSASVGAGELWAMPIGKRDAVLLDLRESLFGSSFTGLTTCPTCEQTLEVTFEAEDVRRDATAVDRETVTIDNFAIAFRLPTSADLAIVERASSIEAGRAALLEACVLSVNCADEALRLDELPDAVIDALTASMAELDPQADVTIDVDCPECAHAWREPFDIVTFAWNELSSWARHLLVDVHTLARAYGWSEESIVSMAPSRRNAYLEMVR